MENMNINDAVLFIKYLYQSMAETTTSEGMKMFGEALTVIIEHVQKVTAEDYQQQAGRTINNKLTDLDKEYHAVLGITSEAGEIAGLYQKEFQGHRIDDQNLIKEIGDLLWFIAELCTVKGVSLGDVMNTNIEKLKKRYPEGFEEERSVNRAEGDV